MNSTHADGLRRVRAEELLDRAAAAAEPGPCPVELAAAFIEELLPLMRDEATDAPSAERAARLLPKLSPSAPESITLLVDALRWSAGLLRNLVIEAIVVAKPANIPFFAALFHDGDVSVRRAAASLMYTFATDIGEALPTVARALQDPDEVVRRESAAALGKMGPAAQAAVPNLIVLLGDEKQYVRTTAAEALGRIGPDMSALPGLLAMLNEGNSYVNGKALQALTPLGTLAAPAVPHLVAMLGEYGNHSEAAALLAEIGPETAPALAALFGDGGDRDGKYRAVELLADFVRDGHDTLAELVKAFRDGDPSIRGLAVQSVGRLGLLGRAAFPAMHDAMSDEDAYVRTMAIEALMQIGAQPDQILSMLTAALTDPNWSNCALPATALAKLGPAGIAKLCEALTHPSPYVRCNAAIGLGAGGRGPEVSGYGDGLRRPATDRRDACEPAASSALEPLIALLLDEEPFVRSEVATALGNFGPTARIAVPNLLALLDDDHCAGAAAMALGRIGEEANRVIPALVSRLNQPILEIEPYSDEQYSPIVRAIAMYGSPAVPMLIEALPATPLPAIEALRLIGEEAVTAISALRRFLSNDQRDTQREAARALSAIGAPAVPALIEVLADPVARRWAMLSLEWIGSAASPAVPELLGLLRRNVEIENEVTDALIAIGATAREFLSVALDDPDSIVRITAAHVLQQVVRADPELVRPIRATALACLSADDRRTRRAAVWVLCTDIARRRTDRSCLTEPQIAAGLLPLLGDLDFEIRTAAAKTLCYLDTPDKAAAVPILVEKVAAEGDCAYELRESFTLVGAAAVPALLQVLANTDERDRNPFRQALAGVGEATLEPLLEALLHGKSEWREEIAQAIGQCNGIQQLLTCLEAINVATRIAALHGLTICARKAIEDFPSATTLFIAALRDPNPEVRRLAVGAMGNTGSANDHRSSERLAAILHVVDDDDSTMRKAAERALAAFFCSTWSFSGIIKLFDSKSDRVRAAAATLLAEHREVQKQVNRNWAINALRERLADSSVLARMAAAAGLCRLRAESPPLPILLDGLTDPDPEIRELAEIGLIWIEGDDPNMTETLSSCIDDDDERVGQAAAQALRSMGSAVMVAQQLAGKLSNPDVATRARAARGLGRLGKTTALYNKDGPEIAAIAVPPLMDALGDADEGVLREAAAALPHLGPDGWGVLALFLETSGDAVRLRTSWPFTILPRGVMVGLMHADDAVRRWAQDYLHRLDSAARREITPELVHCVVASSSYESRREMAALLTAIGVTDSLPSLREDVRGGNSIMRENAALLLSVLAESDPAVGPLLTESLACSDESVRLWSALGLAMLGDEQIRVAVPVLAELAGSRNESCRYLAIRTLCTIGAAAAPVAPSLVAALADPDAGARSSAAEALGRIGEPAAAAAPALARAVRDENESVRRAAVHALNRLPPNATVAAALVAALQDDEPDIRTSAVAGLRRAGNGTVTVLCGLASTRGQEDERFRRTVDETIAELEHCQPKESDEPRPDEGFLLTIWHQPDDDHACLVYADRLEEHGEPGSALIRFEIAAPRLGPADPLRTQLETARAAAEQAINGQRKSESQSWLSIWRCLSRRRKRTAD